VRRTVIAAGLVWLFAFGHWHAPAAGQEQPAAPPVPELMKREVSREGVEYLEKLRKNRTPFGTNVLRSEGVASRHWDPRREPTIKDVKLIKVKVGEIPCDVVVAAGCGPRRPALVHPRRRLRLRVGRVLPVAGGATSRRRRIVLRSSSPTIDWLLNTASPPELDDCVEAHKWIGRELAPPDPGPCRATFVAGDSAGGKLDT